MEIINLGWARGTLRTVLSNFWCWSLVSPKNCEPKRSPDSSVVGLNRHSHPGKSEGLFKRSFLKSHVVVCTNYYGERSLSLNLGVCNERNNVWTEGLVAFQDWCCKMRRNLEKIPEWYLKWVLVRLILRMKPKVHRSKRSTRKLCQNHWVTGAVAVGTEGCLFSVMNFLKFICWHLRVGSRAALVGFIVKHVNKLDFSNKCQQEDRSWQLSELETNLIFWTP